MTARVGVLASGGGSNLQALLDYLDGLGAPADVDVVFVGSDRTDAGALARARARAIPAVALDPAQRSDGLADVLAAHDVDLVALAGYLRLVPADVTRRWAGRILNVHPALLPAFGGAGMYGRRIHEAVIASGVRVTGATVHFVDEQYDRGPILAQWPVPVFPTDTAEQVARRVLCVEHQLYPRAIRAVATGRVTLGADGRVAAGDDRPRDGRFTLAAGAPGAEVAALFSS